MQEAIRLLCDRAADLGMRVPEIQRADAGREIDVLAPLDVPEARAAGAFGEHAVGRRNPARDGPLPAPHEGLIRSGDPNNGIHATILPGPEAGG